MKLNTLTKYRWKAELYMPVQQQDDSYIYELQREVTFDLASGMAQTYLYSKEPIPWAGQLLNIENMDGVKPYFVDGQNIEMFITSSSPVFDIYSRVSGYQHVLMRVAPNGWEKAAVAPAEAEE